MRHFAASKAEPMDHVNLPLVFLIGCALMALLAKKNRHSGYLFFLAAMLPTVPLLLLLPHVAGASLAMTPAVRLPVALLPPLACLLCALRRKQAA